MSTVQFARLRDLFVERPDQKPVDSHSAVAGAIVVLHEESYLQCKTHGRFVEIGRNPDIRNLARDLAEKTNPPNLKNHSPRIVQSP
jgi:hypothetical protein